MLPVHHGTSVQGHEEDLTAASRTHGGEEHLEEPDTHTHTGSGSVKLIYQHGREASVYL